jgi:hypothetical protein
MQIRTTLASMGRPCSNRPAVIDSAPVFAAGTASSASVEVSVVMLLLSA